MSTVRWLEPAELEGVREVEGRVVCRGVGGPGQAFELLRAARVRCQKGGELHDGIACAECERFINYVPARNRRAITIRCQWSLDDPASDLMTRLPAIVWADPEMPVAAADALAERHRIRHLMVAREGELFGIVCRCDLAPPVLEREVVADRMTPNVWALPPHATLRDAAYVMARHEVGCVPIVDGGVLCGVITRGDLRRAGLEQTPAHDEVGVARLG